jgi:threonine dehydrogenase-like Zn-dependent dehydrogenase
MVFFRELRIFGARVYEHKDYTKAISLAASNKLPLERIISRIEPLSRLGEVLEELTSKNTNDMKVLIQCSE